MLRQLLARLAGTALPPKPPQARSPEWGRIRGDWLRRNGSCTACGGKEFLEVHHVIPISVDPGLELNLLNLITLCEKPARCCHLTFGHCYSWNTWNPKVVEDVHGWSVRQSEKQNCGTPRS